MYNIRKNYGALRRNKDTKIKLKTIFWIKVCKIAQSFFSIFFFFSSVTTKKSKKGKSITYHSDNIPLRRHKITYETWERAQKWVMDANHGVSSWCSLQLHRHCLFLCSCFMASFKSCFKTWKIKVSVSLLLFLKYKVLHLMIIIF